MAHKLLTDIEVQGEGLFNGNLTLGTASTFSKLVFDTSGFDTGEIEVGSYQAMWVDAQDGAFSLMGNSSSQNHAITGSMGGNVALNHNGDKKLETVSTGISITGQQLHISSGTANADCVVIIESDTDNNDEASNPRLELRQDAGQVIGRLGYRDNTNSLELINQYAEHLYLGANNSTHLTIRSSGNVGIGTANPTERLVVVGSANITSNLYIGNGNTLKSCTYPAEDSLVVGASNVLGGIANGIIGIGNTIDCTMEPWLNLGGNFIAGLNNDILGYYSHANAIFGQLNELGTSSINNSNTLISGSEHEATVSNALMFGTKCRALSGGTYSLTGGYDSNNFAGFGSVAIGAGATASNGNNQYAFGSGVTTPTFASYAYGADQFVVGKYNEYTNSSYVPHRFAVGNGSGDGSRDTPFCVIGGGTYTNGQVSINDSDGYAYTSIPYSVFHVNGRSTSSYSSGFTVVSDERVKKNIVSYDKGLSEILQVQPKSYVFNGKANTIEGLESIGVLAQEIKEVFPETVGTANKRLNPDDEHETELYAVDISPVTYALINAVKELNAKIETLESRIQTLEGN